MRPEALFPYFTDIEGLPGVGKRTRALIEKLAGPRVRDLLFHLPNGLVDRRYRPKVAEAALGSTATLRLEVVSHKAPPSRRGPYRVRMKDETGFLTLTFFNGRKDYLEAQLPVGEVRLVSGKVEDYQGERQITHPDYMVAEHEADSLPLLEPLYPLTQGLSVKVLRKALTGALESVHELADWLPAGLKDREDWPGFLEALAACHNPDGQDDLLADAPARRRLAYDELLANQLALALARQVTRKKRGRALRPTGALTTKIREALPYVLTGDQDRAVKEVRADLMADTAMLRLLQGDVGSGKTAVAMLAAAMAVEAGTQAALLAPTEILARQHLETLAPIMEQVGVRVALLTGRVKGKAREGLLMALMAGDIDLLIGTHAIIQDSVTFRDLGLAIIDEQHRFGVHQRAALADKAAHGVDVLGMTATPIPRTLTLTAYGDMDTSRIQEKPPGRKPVDTRVVPIGRIHDVVSGLERALASGTRIYWVCPLVSENEQLDLAAAEDRARELDQRFPGQVGLVHGQMKGEEKDRVMDAFQSGTIRVLVATTVIEVGVNVPEATIMVIEHAERFGLAQLHQLRGRVGRGAEQSTCLLLRDDQIGEVASQRLKILRESEDGFLIAEEDLRLRGGGEVLGTRQSGLPQLTFVDYEAHADLMEMARDDARMVAESEDKLDRARGPALRQLLYLFERDAGVKLMKSG